MKKIVMVFGLMIFVSVAFSCSNKSNYKLNGSTFVSCNTVDIHLDIVRYYSPSSKDDNQTATYQGDSIFSYEIKKDDNVVYSYNMTKEGKNSASLQGMAMTSVYEYDNEIVLNEIGSYSIDIYASFVYDYTDEEYALNKNIDFIVSEIAPDTSIPDDFSFDIVFPSGASFCLDEGIYRYGEREVQLELSDEEKDEICNLFSDVELKAIPEEIIIPNSTSFDWFTKRTIMFSYIANGEEKNILVEYYSDDDINNSEYAFLYKLFITDLLSYLQSRIPEV